MTDPYKILGISPTLDAEIIKEAFRKKALETHPDKGGSTEEFNEVVRAYEFLNKNREKIERKIHFERMRKKQERKSNLKAIAFFVGLGSFLLVIAIML